MNVYRVVWAHDGGTMTETVQLHESAYKFLLDCAANKTVFKEKGILIHIEPVGMP